MVLRIKGGGDSKSSFTKSMASEESDEADGPHSSVKGGGEVQRTVEASEVFDGDGSSERELVFSAFFVSRDMSHVYPAIVTVPGCMIYDMPAAQASQPRTDGVARLPAFIFTNEGI